MPLSDLAIQMENVDKKYFLFRKQLKTFVEALKFFRNSTFPSVEPLRTVEELDTLVNRSGQSNATYSSAIKLWLQVYDDLRSLIHEQVLAAQACAPDVTDEVLKIRVTEALEYVNEMTQPDYDVVANKLDEEMTKRLQDTQHDELFHLNFSDRRMFGAIVSLLPLAIDASRKSLRIVNQQVNFVPKKEARSMTPYNQWSNHDWQRHMLKSRVPRSAVTPTTWYGPSREQSAKRKPTDYRPLRPASGRGFTRKL